MTIVKRVVKGSALTYAELDGNFTDLDDRVTTLEAAPPGSGDALVGNPLSQFAATTSAQLRGVLSDETGTGQAVFSNSPALTGTPTAPTASLGTNTTQVATTAFTQAAVAALVDSAPGVLDTLDELAAALGDDANFAASMATALALKAPLASPTFTGTVAGVTKAHVGLGNVDNTSDASKPVSTAATTALALKADLASPALTGNPTAPTQTAGNNTTRLATTAFVTTAVAAVSGGSITDLGDTPGFNPLNRLSTSATTVTTQPNGDYYVAFPAAGGSAVVLANIAAGNAGLITAIQMSCEGGAASFDARLRIFVDQEAAASFDVDLGTLFVSHLDAHTGVGQAVGTDHIQMAATGTNTHPNFTPTTSMVSYQMQFPVPYSDGIKIEVYTPAGVSVAGTSYFFSSVFRRDSIGTTLRLRAQGLSRVDANAGSAYVAASDITLFDIPNNYGWAVWLSASMFGATNYSYLERPWRWFKDGESTEQFIFTGGEEFGATGWYFAAAARIQTPSFLLTASNNASFTTVLGVDLLRSHGGVRFENRLKLVSGNKTTNPASSNHKMGWCVLYYVDTAVSFVPTAPRSVVATAGNAQATVTYTAPASIGSSAVTLYTATSSPGGFTGTANGAGGAITVTGLTNGTGYTFTVKATNATGQSSASSASNSVTPATITVPGAPTGASATAGNAQATVTFTAPASNGGATITGYTATSTPGSFTGNVSGSTASPITVTGLTNGTGYTFTVHATNSVGNSSESSATSLVTPSAGVSVADDFNRSNATTLGTTPTGSKTWATFTSEDPAEVGIDTNRAYVRTDPASGTGYAYVNTGVSNIDVTVTLAVVGANANFPGLIARAVDANNMVLLQYDAATGAATTYSAYKKISGAYTLLGSTTGITPTAGDVLRLVVNGTNTVDFYVNGSHFGPYTATGISSSSQNAGIQAGTASGVKSTARFDDFSVV